MPTPHYLIVHVPGRGQLSLSLPEGVERAFRYGRLPDSSLVWHSAGEVWLPILLHPAIARIREAALADASDYAFDFQSSESVQRIDPVPVEAAIPEPPPLPIEPEAPIESEDPALLPLLPIGEWKHHLAELSRMVARSSAQDQRREAGRNSGGGKRRETGPVFFAGVAAEVLDPHDIPPPVLARFRTRVLAGALILLVAMGIGGWLWYQSPSPALVIAPTTPVLSARVRDSLARVSAASNTHITAHGPLADLEADLENDLRIAEAVIWQPAIDFASQDQVVRSTRKLNAVRNSIGHYRLGAWRLGESLDQENDPRLEPFLEAERVDKVVGLMTAAVAFLDSTIGHFRVSGDLLVFEQARDAERYSAISRTADSLLRAPVELDSLPSIRAPRRVVTRLLETLPSAVAASPAQP